MKTISTKRFKQNQDRFGCGSFFVADRFEHERSIAAQSPWAAFVDLTITVGNMSLVSGGGFALGTAGEAITIGMLIFQSTDRLMYKADCDHATAIYRTATAIAFSTAAAAGQGVVYASGRPIVGFGAILTIAMRYYTSDTAGGIMPEADLEVGDYPQLIGIAITTSNMQMDFQGLTSTVAIAA